MHVTVPQYHGRTGVTLRSTMSNPNPLTDLRRWHRSNIQFYENQDETVHICFWSHVSFIDANHLSASYANYTAKNTDTSTSISST